MDQKSIKRALGIKDLVSGGKPRRHIDYTEAHKASHVRPVLTIRNMTGSHGDVMIKNAMFGLYIHYPKAAGEKLTRYLGTLPKPTLERIIAKLKA